MTSTHTNDTDNIRSCQNITPSEVKLTLHHQLPGIELVSPMCVSDGSICYLSPDHKVDAGSTAQIGFNIDLTRDESVGVLMYKLQRKNAEQLNGDDTFSEDGATCTLLIMIWNVNSFKDFYVYSRVIEQDKGCVWDRDKLIKLAKRYSLLGIQHCFIEEAWLTHDGIALMTSLNTTCEAECYKLEMTISEPSTNNDTQRPWHIDLDR
jgi:hypothetical protein